MKKLLLTILFGALFAGAFSQDSDIKNEKRKHPPLNLLEINLHPGNEQLAASINYQRLHPLTNNNKLRLGYGIRFTGYFADVQDYLTAPSSLTKDESKIDTMVFTKSQVNALNVTFNFQYKITPKLDVGFNIDVAGISFGQEQNGNFISSVWPSSLPVIQQAKPTHVNLLMVGDNDRGTLNSEFFARYWITEKLGVKAGFGLLFVEYKTENILTFDNDRFRNKAFTGLAGLTFNPLN